MFSTNQSARAIQLVLFGIVCNVVFAAVKLAAGISGESYALIADGVESLLDLLSSSVVLGGVLYAARPADNEHPYGHGKAEFLASLIVALVMGLVGLGIGVLAVFEILTPQHPPALFTLWVLLGVIILKELLARSLLRMGTDLESSALQADGWHHRADSLTSICAAIGIALAALGGPRFVSADDWAALIAAIVIVLNALALGRRSASAAMDEIAPDGLYEKVKDLGRAVPGVIDIEKCRIRQSGRVRFVDIHVIVDGDLSVTRGHAIGGAVREALRSSPLKIADALIHVEPAGQHDSIPASISADRSVD